MDSIPDSTQIPLLDPPIQKSVPAYFDTNILDNYLFFWVNKFVNVSLKIFDEFSKKFNKGGK